MDHTDTPGQGLEQRRWPRRSLDIRVNLAFDAIAHAKDISYGGICLITDKPLEIRKMYTINCSLPDDGLPIELFGKVEWSRPAGEHHFENGISFWRIDRPTEQRLIEFLQAKPH